MMESNQSTVDAYLRILTEETVRQSFNYCAPKHVDLSELRQELEYQVKAAMVRVVWATEKQLGAEPGTIRAL